MVLRLIYVFSFFAVCDAVMEMFMIRADEFSEKHSKFNRMIVRACFLILAFFVLGGFVSNCFFIFQGGSLFFD